MLISEGSPTGSKLRAFLDTNDKYVQMALVGVILAAIVLLMQPSKEARAAGALWFLLP